MIAQCCCLFPPVDSHPQNRLFVLLGACEGTLACSTCHLIFKPEHYKQLPEPPTDEELDMLDLAYDLQDTYVMDDGILARYLISE